MEEKQVKKPNEFLRFLKYSLFAASAGIIQVLSFTLLNELLHWPYWISYGIALVLSVIWNFTINRRFTFKSANNIPKAMFLVFLYYLVFTPLTLHTEWVFTEIWGWNEYLATAVNIVFNFITEFLYQRYYVFKDSIDTNDLAKKKQKLELEEVKTEE